MSSKIQELKDKISPKALRILRGTGCENDEEILIDLAELTEEHQIKASECLILSPEKIIKRFELMERYPDKDKNIMRFQLSDDYMEKAERVIQAERWRSIPFLAKKLLEDYLNRYDKVEEQTELNESNIA